MTRDDAELLASDHRARYGDDVVRHDPDDEGDFFVCEDCGWLVTFVDDPDYPFWDDDEPP